MEKEITRAGRYIERWREMEREGTGKKRDREGDTCTWL